MSGMNTLASTALGITETMEGFIEARSTVFSLLKMQKKHSVLQALLCLLVQTTSY